MDEYIIYVIDTETTGLDPEKNEIIELSAARFKMITHTVVEQKTWLLKALKPEFIEDEALQINKHKKEDILHFTDYGKSAYIHPEQAIVDIENWIMEDRMSSMDRILVGQNIDFDIQMMMSLWKSFDAKDTFPFNLENGNRTVDTKMLATVIDLCTGRRRRYYNLSTLISSFNIKKRKAHRAEDDVAMTVDLLLAMLRPLIPAASEAFQECYTNLDE